MKHRIHEQNWGKMQTYYGTKKLMARPMTLGEYNDYRGWTLPEDEHGTDQGYLVEYCDGGKSNDHRHKGYISWSPAGVFEAAYQPTDRMNFSHALAAMKDGYNVCRSSDPTGTNLHIRKIDYDAPGEAKEVIYSYGTLAALSQFDLLATDWMIVEAQKKAND